MNRQETSWRARISFSKPIYIPLDNIKYTSLQGREYRHTPNPVHFTQNAGFFLLHKNIKKSNFLDKLTIIYYYTYTIHFLWVNATLISPNDEWWGKVKNVQNTNQVDPKNRNNRVYLNFSCRLFHIRRYTRSWVYYPNGKVSIYFTRWNRYINLRSSALGE